MKSSKSADRISYAGRSQTKAIMDTLREKLMASNFNVVELEALEDF